MRSREGVSLIELIVLMTAVSTILSFTVVLLHRTMRAHNRSQATHADEQAAWRLSGALRRDLTKAVEAETEPGPDSVWLRIRSQNGDLVRYRFASLAVTRRQEPQAEGRTASEEYTLSGPTDWVVKVLDEPRRLVVQTATEPIERTRAIAPVKIRLVSRLRGKWIQPGATP